MNRTVLLYIILLIGCNYVPAQSIFDVYRDSTEVVVPEKEVVIPVETITEASENPFEVSHIPIRKNQVEANKAVPEFNARDNRSKTTSNSGSAIPLGICIFCSCILGIILFNNREILKDIRLGITNRNYLASLKNKINGSTPIVLGLYLVFALNLGLFIYLSFKDEIGNSSLLTLVYIVLGILALYMGRHFLMSLFGWIFELEKEAESYSIIIGLANICLGVALIPINLIYAFGPESFQKAFFYLGLIILVAFLLFRFGRGLMISNKYLSTKTFQFFLYFCTFEIAPVLIILYNLGIF